MYTLTIELPACEFPQGFFSALGQLTPNVTWEKQPSDPGNAAYTFAFSEPMDAYAIGWIHAQFGLRNLETLKNGAAERGIVIDFEKET